MATQSIYFSKFKLINSLLINEIVEILVSNTDSNEKFIINDYNDQYVDGIYIITYVSNESMFNLDRMAYDSIEVIRNIAINFSIDTHSNIMEIWGNKNNAQKLLTKLSVLFQNKVIIDNINITIPDVIKRLKNYNAIVGKVKIEDVLLQDNLIASCIFDLSNHENRDNILDKYKEKLTQISVVLKDDNNISITVSVYSSGSVLVYRNRDDISNTMLNIIKQICIGGS